MARIEKEHGNRMHGAYSKSASARLRKTLVCWGNMIHRCTKPWHPCFKNYGGRGITVCPRWKRFTNFLQDMGEKPEGMTLERKENNNGYSKNNCCWATRSQQNKNKRQRKGRITGLTGVYINKRNGKFYALIYVNKKAKQVGTFLTIEEAAKARRAAEVKYGFTGLQ